MQIGDWESDRWYIALTVAAGIAFAAALAAPMPAEIKRATLLLAAGAFLVGIGEWMQHPRQELLDPNMRWKAHGFFRRWRFMGVVLDVAGLVLAGRGLWLLW